MLEEKKKEEKEDMKPFKHVGPNGVNNAILTIAIRSHAYRTQ